MNKKKTTRKKLVVSKAVPKVPQIELESLYLQELTGEDGDIFLSASLCGSKGEIYCGIGDDVREAIHDLAINLPATTTYTVGSGVYPI